MNAVPATLWVHEPAQHLMTDALTGLTNRVLLAERLGRTLPRARQSGEHGFAQLMIDLDDSIQETEGQMAIPREFGCDYVQGYLFGRPLPAEEAERLLSAAFSA